VAVKIPVGVWREFDELPMLLPVGGHRRGWRRGLRLASDVARSPLWRLLAGWSVPGRRSGLIPRELLQEGEIIDQHLREGRFQRSLALIAGLSGLLGGMEVTTQHVQGSYGQRVMYSPVVLSPLVFVAGVWGFFSRRIARTLLPVASLALLLDGALGFIFHIRGVARKPGGWRIPVFNVVMGPPLFAPLLLGIGGFLGLIASFLRREDNPQHLLGGILSRPHVPRWLSWLPRGLTREGLTLEQDVREGRFQRTLAGATAVSAVLNGMESLYSHYKNNFRYQVQWLPIVLSPIIAVVGVAAIFNRAVARTQLPLVSLAAIATGLTGFFYHVRGVSRMAGGLKLPLYNIIYGPPVFAPLLYAATGFLGMLASLLRREK
jgi:hypothetical protein